MAEKLILVRHLEEMKAKQSLEMLFLGGRLGQRQADEQRGSRFSATEITATSGVGAWRHTPEHKETAPLVLLSQMY